jgi:hypothetical protein
MDHVAIAALILVGSGVLFSLVSQRPPTYWIYAWAEANHFDVVRLEARSLGRMNRRGWLYGPAVYEAQLEDENGTRRSAMISCTSGNKWWIVQPTVSVTWDS